MALISLPAYAKTHSVSKQAASKWKARGFLVLDGSLVDTEASDQKLRDAGLGRFKEAASPTQPTTARSTDDVVDAMVEASAHEDTLQRFVAELVSGKVRTTADAAQVKENALALKHSLEALKVAGAVIPRELAETALFESARHERDAWLNFPAKIGPLLAADLKIEPGPVVEALTAHVHAQIADLGEPEADFTGGQS